MADLPRLDLDDPLLVHFVYQHDLRARLWHQLEEIVDVLRSDDDPEDKVAAARAMAEDAVNPQSVIAWLREGRPLPYIESQNPELTESLNNAIESLLDAAAEE